MAYQSSRRMRGKYTKEYSGSSMRAGTRLGCYVRIGLRQQLCQGWFYTDSLHSRRIVHQPLSQALIKWTE